MFSEFHDVLASLERHASLTAVSLRWLRFMFCHWQWHNGARLYE